MTAITIRWARTATGAVAHALTPADQDVAACGAMPLQQSALWGPERTRRFYERGEGEWVDDPGARRCGNCQGALAKEGVR